MRQMFRRDAGAVVKNNECSGTVDGLGRNANFAAGVVVLNCVGQEVQHHLRHAFGIAMTTRRQQLRADRDASRVRQRTDHLNAFTRGVREIKSDALHRLLPRIEPGEFEQ